MEMTMPFDPREHLTNIQGRPYLDVANRLLWLNADATSFTIETVLLEHDADTCIVRATVSVTREGMTAMASAHGSADRRNLRGPIAARWLEKAETAAVGRALGMLGYGTQYAAEFDDAADDHLADAPGRPAQPLAEAPAPRPAAAVSQAAPTPMPHMGGADDFWKSAQALLQCNPSAAATEVMHRFGQEVAAYKAQHGLAWSNVYALLEANVRAGEPIPGAPPSLGGRA